jgi:hypothetical protein
MDEQVKTPKKKAAHSVQGSSKKESRKGKEKSIT